MSKPKRDKIVTPVGIVKYASIGKPKTTFNADGEYSCDLILDPADATVLALQKRCEDLAAAAKAEALGAETNPAKKKALNAFALSGPFSQELDKEGNYTGMLVFRAKQKALIRIKGKDPFEKTVKVFDARQNEMTNKNIGRGTKLKIAGTCNPFVMPANKIVGITVWLEAVQVLELHEFGGQDAGDYGFATEEGFTEERPEGAEAFDPSAEVLDGEATGNF